MTACPSPWRAGIPSMESTERAGPADAAGEVPEFGEALLTILALGPAGARPVGPGETVWDGLRHLHRIISDSLLAQLEGGADEKAKAAYRAGRASLELIIEAAGYEI